MDRLPPLKSLLAFEAVSRWLSVTRAAEELHVTQSAVSQQLRTLEDTLGFPLFVRENQGLQLTAKGRMLAPSVRNGFSTISTCLAEINHRDKSVNVLVASEGLLSFMMQRLPDFQAQRSDVRIWLAPLTNNAMANSPGTDIIIRQSNNRAKGRDKVGTIVNCPALRELGFDVTVNVASDLSEAVEAFLSWLQDWESEATPTNAAAYSLAENGARSSALSPTPMA